MKKGAPMATAYSPHSVTSSIGSPLSTHGPVDHELDESGPGLHADAAAAAHDASAHTAR